MVDMMEMNEGSWAKVKSFAISCLLLDQIELLHFVLIISLWSVAHKGPAHILLLFFFLPINLFLRLTTRRAFIVLEYTMRSKQYKLIF